MSTTETVIVTVVTMILAPFVLFGVIPLIIAGICYPFTKNKNDK